MPWFAANPPADLPAQDPFALLAELSGRPCVPHGTLPGYDEALGFTHQHHLLAPSIRTASLQRIGGPVEVVVEPLGLTEIDGRALSPRAAEAPPLRHRGTSRKS
jgi:hypothetical protein